MSDHAYYSAMRDRACRALKSANRSGCAKRRAAAMRAINHFARQAYNAGV